MTSTYTTTVPRQPTAEDAKDVARRRAEEDGWKVTGYLREPFRGVITGSWVVEMAVERRGRR